MVGNVKKVWILKTRSQNRVGEVQRYASKRLLFHSKLFSKALRKFSIRRMTVFNILESLSKIISLRSRKNRNHKTRQTEYMAGNVTKVWILKNSLSESGW